MAELNQRQIAHRRAMLAHMTQVARRGESRFFLIQGARGRADRLDRGDNAPRITSSSSPTPKPGRPEISIVPPVNRSAATHV